MVALWDVAKWNQTEWNGAPPTPGGWGDDWQWWYQPPTGPTLALNEKVVEARWTTDAHTMGDGTFRGDLQPGTLTLRLWDPTHSLDNLDKYGAVWAWYKPTGAAWAWFYDSFTRGLVAPGDPAGADCVFSGLTWPARLTALRTETHYPAQSVAARLAALVASMNSTANIHLPAVTGAIAAQSQTVAATVADSTYTTFYPSYLAQLRDAASAGVAWLGYTTPGANGPGAMVVNYARWETAAIRTLDRSQIVAGPPSTNSIGFLINWVRWAAIGPTGTATGLDSNNLYLYGSDGLDVLGPLRLYGTVSVAGAEYNGAFQTGQQLVSDHADPTEQTLSTVDVQSGNRWTSTGHPSAAIWDPHAHTWAPTEVARIDMGGGHIGFFRVTKSDHRLTSTVWETSHYLEKYTVPTALP